MINSFQNQTESIILEPTRTALWEERRWITSSKRDTRRTDRQRWRLGIIYWGSTTSIMSYWITASRMTTTSTGSCKTRIYPHSPSTLEKVLISPILSFIFFSFLLSYIILHQASNCEPEDATQLGKDLRKVIIAIYDQFLTPDGTGVDYDGTW